MPDCTTSSERGISLGIHGDTVLTCADHAAAMLACQNLTGAGWKTAKQKQSVRPGKSALHRSDLLGSSLWFLLDSAWPIRARACFMVKLGSVQMCRLAGSCSILHRDKALAAYSQYGTA